MKKTLTIFVLFAALATVALGGCKSMDGGGGSSDGHYGHSH